MWYPLEQATSINVLGLTLTICWGDMGLIGSVGVTLRRQLLFHYVMCLI